MKVKKQVSFIMATILASSGLLGNYHGNVAYAETENSTNEVTKSYYHGDGYGVHFALDSQWEGGYTATMTIHNTSEYDIENWCINFALDSSIQNMWNAQIVEEENGIYTIKNADWNQDIQAGESVSFGFVSNEKFGAFPSSYDMLGTMAQVVGDQYAVTYEITADWESGFNGQIVIKNISDE